MLLIKKLIQIVSNTIKVNFMNQNNIKTVETTTGFFFLVNSGRVGSGPK